MLLKSLSSSSRYLEIGVETGQTFFDVSASFKTAVDPKFLFEVNTWAYDEKVEFFEITSDNFFNQLSTSSKYDLVFLDGLHTWEQTYRDFCNTLLVTHNHSIILIDDIFPCDVFSCSRDQTESLMMRQLMVSDSSNAWHGDTYKVIPLIQAFHPMLSYCTIVTDGNPQTMVWRSKTTRRCGAELMLTNLGDLNMTSLDYLWFLRNQGSYNLMSEYDALELVAQSIRK